jgi:hypothetical protein
LVSVLDRKRGCFGKTAHQRWFGPGFCADFSGIRAQMGP